MRFSVAISVVLFTSVCCTVSSADKIDIAVADLKKIASEAVAGKSIDEQIREANRESKKDLLDLESKIKSMESSKKSDYDARKIEDMQLILYDMIRNKKYQISNAYSMAVAVLDREIKKAIREVCKEKHIKIVLDSGAAIYNECPDITNDIINKVNKSCQSIKVELEKSK